MVFGTRIGRVSFLSLLLLLATSTTKHVAAKDNQILSSSSVLIERILQEDESKPDDVGEDQSGDNYTPFDNGTMVRFEDQDGTWMFGIVWDYNSSTQTYTIEWDEDSVHEDISDLEKVEQMVNAAKDNNYNKVMNDGDFPASAREEEEDWEFDFDYEYDYDDLINYEPWMNETPVLLEFADGYFMGKITKFELSADNKVATYLITWSDGTTDMFRNELERIDLMAANAMDYEPWEVGTPTFGYPNPDATEQISGKITAFGDGAYAVTWSNKHLVIYNDFDEVDMLVNSAANNLDPTWVDNYDPWPKGTDVSWNFDDGWWDGSITDFSSGTYEVTWSDGSLKSYSNIEKVDQMVAYADGEGFLGNLAGAYDADDYDDDYYNDYYDLETLVYAEYTDGWWAGYIDSYDDDYYVIRWSDDSVDKFLPGDDMDQMVVDGQNIPDDYNLWSEGTAVYSEFEGTWYWGTIEISKGGFYTVLWEDGSRTTYVSGSAIDEMVYNAYKGRGFPFGRIILAIVLLSGVGGIAFYVINRRKRRLAAEVNAQVRENELDLEQEEEEGEDVNMMPRVV